jgi:hypothetical protein
MSLGALVYEESNVPHRMLKKDEEDLTGADRPAAGRHGGHSHWLMLACCVPLVVAAIVLVAAGVVSAGFIVAAFACMAMMGAMMFLMMSR